MPPAFSLRLSQSEERRSLVGCQKNEKATTRKACFNFKEDFTTLSGYRYDDRHRTKKPRKARRDPLGKDNRNYIYNYQLPDGELVAEEVIRKRKFGQGRQVGQS